MTRTMSIIFMIALFQNVQFLYSSEIALQEKLKIQKERIELTGNMINNIDKNKSKKEQLQCVFCSNTVPDIEINGGSGVYNYSLGGNILMQVSGDHNNITGNVHNSLRSINIILSSADHNNISLNYPYFSSASTMNVKFIDSDHNQLSIYSFGDIKLNVVNKDSDFNGVHVYSPLRKLIMPLIMPLLTAAILYGGYKVFWKK